MNTGELWGCSGGVFIVALLFPRSQVQGQPLMVQVSGGQLITSTGQPIMVQAVPGGQGQTIMQVPVSGTQGLQQVRHPGGTAQPGDALGCSPCHAGLCSAPLKPGRGGALWLWRGGNEWKSFMNSVFMFCGLVQTF